MTLGLEVGLAIIFHLYLYFSEILKAKKTLTLTEKVTSVPSLCKSVSTTEMLLSILLTLALLSGDK
jgi:hypothetical protein